jgi:hypothetical protein
LEKPPAGIRRRSGADALPLAPRRAPDRIGPFHKGAHAPFAIRWFGMTALTGHLRHLLAVTAASNQLDLRDWMRPEDSDALLDRVGHVLGASPSGRSLTERLGREVWLDFVADTGDDYDVSAAVARMLFAEYAVSGAEPRTLPRGDLLLFGGDTAYPAASAKEIERRLLRPWNRALRHRADGRPRVLLGIPGNHDWYDGLDGFGRLFRRSATGDLVAPTSSADGAGSAGTSAAIDDPAHGRAEGVIQRHLHVDELAESIRLAEEAIESLAALLRRSTVQRAGRLTLAGYTAVQEASYWALPLAPALDLWGVDRQLRGADFRQRVFFAQRRVEAAPRKILFVAPDPALAYGEPNLPGTKLLEACGLRLASSRLFYLTADFHHYERHTVEGSVHVVAGGGGAFLHGTRLDPAPSGARPDCVYPDRRTSLRLALGMPLKLAAGAAGFLPHILFASLAAIELAALRRGPVAGAVATVALTLVAIFGLSLAVHARLERPVATWTVSGLFGLILGLTPLGLRTTLPQVLPWLPGFGPVILAHAFLGSLVLGVFLLTLALTGLERQQGFAALGHPGFRHFVRLRVEPGGRVEGFVIGKDDPIGKGPPVLIDRFVWE